MKLSNIRDILAVAEAGSLRGGSRKLGITQPTMTRSIRETEKELGVSLFTRHGQGVSLTPMGQLFVRRAAAIQSEVRHIVEEIDQAKGSLTGRVSVAMSTAAMIAILPKVINSFQSEYPDVILNFTESLLLEPVESSILAGEIDFFVGPILETPLKPPLVLEKLFDNRRVVIARRGHPLCGATSLADLRDARWIRPSFANPKDEREFNAMFAKAGVPPPRIVAYMHSAMMTLLAVAGSDLLALLPAQWLEFPFFKEQIDAIELAEAVHAAPLCIVRRGDLPLTPLAERFCDLTRRAGLNYARKFVHGIERP